MNLNGEYLEIRGLSMDASEQAIAKVTGLPQTGERWFFRKRHNLRVAEEFLGPGQKVQRRDRGVALETSPRPWDQVTIFLKRYITCEGIYKVVYIYEFFLLSHLQHHILINMPFYLSQTLQNMAHYSKNSRCPLSSLTNHELIKLLVQRCLAQNNLTWEQFVWVGVHHAHGVAHIGDREVEQSSSDLAGGRNEELEEGQDEKEEN